MCWWRLRASAHGGNHPAPSPPHHAAPPGLQDVSHRKRRIPHPPTSLPCSPLPPAPLPSKCVQVAKSGRRQWRRVSDASAGRPSHVDPCSECTKVKLSTTAAQPHVRSLLFLPLSPCHNSPLPATREQSSRRRSPIARAAHPMPAYRPLSSAAATLVGSSDSLWRQVHAVRMATTIPLIGCIRRPNFCHISRADSSEIPVGSIIWVEIIAFSRRKTPFARGEPFMLSLGQSRRYRLGCRSRMRMQHSGKIGDQSKPSCHPRSRCKRRRMWLRQRPSICPQRSQRTCSPRPQGTR